MKPLEIQSDLELWGGLECTINRVGDDFFDQLQHAGHWNRAADIAQITELGIHKIRYPVLWEHHQKQKTTAINWTLTEHRLQQLREFGITPIAGLLHHGSGPIFTHLLDPEFPQKFANYALHVAKKFPWLNYYTPINEPLTTARFSGLYGLWYPHSRDDFSFLNMLINECKASILAMKAIRSVNPDCKWIQTEDLGKTHSTQLLHYQADFENRRRWLGFDLLAGRVNASHPLWDYLIWAGLNPKQLDWFEQNALEPNIIGFNYYLTSERYLDENLMNYPKENQGANHLHPYADTEAVRACPEKLSGIKELLTEAWAYLRKPMAITEVHLHCSREEQLRWIKEIWEQAQAVKREGIPLCAVTVWALMGSFGWDRLLTQAKGTYESGVFDISSGTPRPTALFKLIQQLPHNAEPHHPVLAKAGWWKRKLLLENIPQSSSLKPIVIIGKNGTLGQAFARICEQRAIDYKLLDRTKLDIRDMGAIVNSIRRYQPWAIVNAAGYVQVDAAESEPGMCFSSNTQGAKNLAKACADYHISLLSFSSDLVFDGHKTKPYLENDIPNPLNVYGQSKVQAEEQLLNTYPKTLVIRTSSFFGPWDEKNFASRVLQQLNLNQKVYAAQDLFISPTYIPELVNTCLDLLIDEESGIWHLANQAALSWFDFASAIACQAGYRKTEIIGVNASDLGFIAKRPKYSVLSSTRGAFLSDLDQALAHFFNQQEILTKNYS